MNPLIPERVFYLNRPLTINNLQGPLIVGNSLLKQPYPFLLMIAGWFYPPIVGRCAYFKQLPIANCQLPIGFLIIAPLLNHW
jgi:hypothetical protein